MVSPHLAPSCWAHSMPRSHCSHLRGTSESHSNIRLADFPLGLPVTLHGWWKWSRRAAELPIESVSLWHLILRHAELKPILWAFFSLRPNFILMTNKWKHKSLKLSLFSFELGWCWALYGAQKLHMDGQRQSSSSNWGHCTEGTLHCYNSHTLEANN